MQKNRKITDLMMLLFLAIIYIPIFAWHSSYIPQVGNSYILAVAVLCPLFNGVKRKIKIKNLMFALIIILLSGVMLYTGQMNTSYGNGNGFSRVLRLFLLMYIVYTLFAYAIKENKEKTFWGFWYILTLLLVVINDLLTIRYYSAFTVEWAFPVGTKFDVVYLHYQLIVLGIVYHMGSNKRKLRFSKLLTCFYYMTAFYMAIKLNCMTGLVGIAVLLIMLLLISKFKDFFINPKIYIAALLVSCAFIFVYNRILELSFVQKVVTDIFHKDITMTGRTHIYDSFFTSMKGHWLTGYGYQNSYDVSIKLFTYNYHTYANTQNGLAEWILRVGIVGTVLVVVLVAVVFARAKTSGFHELYIPVMGLLYTFAILASVEITLEVPFLFWITILLPISHKKNPSNNLTPAVTTHRKRIRFKWKAIS